MKNLSLLSIATLLGLSFTTGCIAIDTDDLGTDTTLDTNDDVDDATTDATDDATTDATDDDVGTTDESTGDGDGDTTDDATTDATTTTDETTDGGLGCGWNARGPYYECGFEGADPDGNFPLECPDGLVDGDPCDTTGLTGEGCCDANGDNWYCTQEGVVFLSACG
jgi:hypothetical protein